MPATASTPEQLRLYRDLTMRALAARANVGISTISRIEKGTPTFVLPVTVIKIAKALGCSKNEYIDAMLAVRRK